MAQKKTTRTKKQQLGQFMTPPSLVEQILTVSHGGLIQSDSRILEPSFGTGEFLFQIIDQLLEETSEADKEKKIHAVLKNVYGVELDSDLFNAFKQEFYNRYHVDLDSMEHNFYNMDFFQYHPNVKFDIIVGNPPFGGTLNPEYADALDRAYGTYDDGERVWKIKKETYAFFVVKCLNLLTDSGELLFILSDTFMSINTMQGLRRLLLASGKIQVAPVEYFSDETTYKMVLLHLDKSEEPALTVDGRAVDKKNIEKTANYSWIVPNHLLPYFTGTTLGEYITASSGMTTGNNALFVRELQPDGSIEEPYTFTYTNQPVTVETERGKARNQRLSTAQEKTIRLREQAGETVRVLTPVLRIMPLHIPHPLSAGYVFYNKSHPKAGMFYRKPTSVIFWQNNGEAVLNFKKNGSWYLRGVGGQRFFMKEGITWNLIASRLRVRYLPEGYVLDSGAPLAVLNDGVNHDELWFILGWLNTNIATEILKKVINHTRNIQGKDVERLPYPSWVTPQKKKKAVKLVKTLVSRLQHEEGAEASLEEMRLLESYYLKDRRR